MAFCLPKKQADELLSRIQSGDITPESLLKMTSKERRTYFGTFMDEATALEANLALERKLILKNQKAGILRWAKNVTGLTKTGRRELLERVNDMDFLQPANQEAFLEDLVAARLGVTTSAEEASKILNLAKKTSKSKEEMLNSPRRKPGAMEGPTAKELKYGLDAAEFQGFVADLKDEAAKISPLDVIKGRGKGSLKLITDIAGTSKSINSSMDNSALFRQGWKTLFTNPKIWAKNSAQSFVDIYKTFKGTDAEKVTMARIISDPNYDKMKQAKLAVGTIEEAFPNKIPKKIPFLSKAYKASQDAYAGFLHQTRADVFNKYLQTAEGMGLDTTDKAFLEATGRYINALTGRSKLPGQFEAAANAFNSIFFSPRLFVSHLETIASPATSKNAFIRKQAATNLVKMMTGAASVYGIAHAINPDLVESDMRSANFGKIKIGDTRFDFLGGMGSIGNLAARLVTGETKSSTSGKITKLEPGFGKKSRWDVITTFTENKFGPIPRSMMDWMKGETFGGDKPTLSSTSAELFTPLGLRSAWQDADEPGRANLLMIMILDGLGVASNTY